MLTKRIIPCLDIKDGRTVKGTNFVNLRDAGDPVELGAIYAEQGADELVFLDIEASKQNRLISLDFVKEVGEEANMPFAVGGGIKSLEDIQKIIHAGAENSDGGSAGPAPGSAPGPRQPADRAGNARRSSRRPPAACRLSGV